MEQQGPAVRQVVAGGFERVGEDVVAADLHPGRVRVGEKARVGVGGYDLASGSGLGGQPAGHRAGSAPTSRQRIPASGPNMDKLAEGARVIARLQQAQPAQFIVETRVRVQVAARHRACPRKPRHGGRSRRR